MSYKLVTAQTDWAVELPEVKKHCRIDDTSDDAYLQELIYSAQDQLKSEYDLYLNEETYDLWLDEFPSHEIEIWKWPVNLITSIKYYDTNGDAQTVSTDDYSADLYGKPARIIPAYGYTWPVAQDILNTVQVRFTTGFISPAVIPADIKSAMYLIIKDRFDNREDKGRRFPRLSEIMLTKYKYKSI
jgi:uncharacterized phiE125 gp8 family phage protein